MKHDFRQAQIGYCIGTLTMFILHTLVIIPRQSPELAMFNVVTDNILLIVGSIMLLSIIVQSTLAGLNGNND